MKEPRRQVYLQRVGLFLPPPPVLANIHVVLRVFFSPERTVTSTDKLVYASLDVPGIHNVGLPIQYRLNVVPVSQPIAV